MSHEPSKQVEVRATDEHAAGELTEADEYEVQVPPLAVREQPADAAHDRKATEQEEFAPGAVDHEPALHVDDTATDEQAAGEVTVGAEYEVHVPPWAVVGQPPEVKQPAVHEALLYGVGNQPPL